MRNKVAKKLRKIVYGDMSIKNRQYAQSRDGNIIADVRRRMYQNLKREYKNALHTV